MRDKLTVVPAPPTDRLLSMLLLDTLRSESGTLRIQAGGERTTILIGSTPAPSVPGNMFRPMVDTLLRWTGIRRWPWTRKIAARGVEVESETRVVAFSVSSSNLGQAIVLDHVRSVAEFTSHRTSTGCVRRYTMKQITFDKLGIGLAGLLLTAILCVVPYLLRYLESSSAIVRSSAWWDYYFYRDKLCLAVIPTLAAFMVAKRTRFNPLVAGMCTCLIPAIAYFAVRYAMNMHVKEMMYEGGGFIHHGGYVDPFDLAGNLDMWLKPGLWALLDGSAGGVIAFFWKRRVASKRRSLSALARLRLNADVGMER